MSYARHLLDTCPVSFDVDADLLAASCGDECERHAQLHEHCRVCAEACRSCERACRDLLGAVR